MVQVAEPNSQPTVAVGLGRKNSSAAESSARQSTPYEETRDDGTDFVTERSVQTRESSPPDEVEALRSPQMLTKLKSFSPKALTSPRRREKSGHFFNDGDTKTSSPKKMETKVMSPKAAATPSPKESQPDAEKKKVEEDVVLAVAPGRLGLALKIDKELGGAKIMSLHPACAFHGKVDVGDHIVAIDDREVTKLADFKVDSDKKRNFTIRRNANLSEPSTMSPPHQQLKEDKASLVPSQTSKSETSRASSNENEEYERPLNLTLLITSESDDESFDSSGSHTTFTKEENFGNELLANRFICANTEGFVANRFNCYDANTVKSNSSSTIKTFLGSLLQCGTEHDNDNTVVSNDVEAEEMSKEIPSIRDISQLKVSDHAFIKRSNGIWTYSTVIEVQRDSITFALDNFGNGKTITKHRWISSIRLVKSDEDDTESIVAGEHSTSTSSSSSYSMSQDEEDEEEDVYKSGTSAAAERKEQLKTILEQKKMALKAKKEEKKRKKQKAKAAAAEAKRKEREIRDAQELEIKLRLMELEELKIAEKADAEEERRLRIEEKKAKKLAELEGKKRTKMAAIAKAEAKKRAELQKKRRKKMAEMEEREAERR